MVASQTARHPVLRNMLVRESHIAAPLLFLVVFLSMGGMVKFGPAMPASWALVYLVGFSWFLLTPVKTASLWLKFWPLLLLPAIALISMTWSADPAGTFRTGFQFAFSTLLAIRIATALTARQAIWCLFLGTTLGCALSVAAFVLPPLQPAFESNGAFVGIFVQKTVAGVALTLFVLSLCAQGALWGHRIVAFLLALAVIPLLLMTQSISAMVLLSCSSLIVFQGVFVRWTAAARLSLFLLLVALFGTWLLILWIAEFDIVAFGLDLLGKSPTLTGRTDIWDLGIQVAEDHPVLGVGYAAFWENPAFAVEWGFLHATVDPRLKGFHNTYIEALATTGVISVILLVFVYYWTMLKAGRWFIESCSVQSAFWLAIIVSALLLSFVDNVLFAEHEFFHIAATLTFVFATVERGKYQWAFRVR
ncbi:O-antigen ligase family protein [Roseovarius sp. Pro17]|uniref:O-antigen ligase family protein n=1 Tax=Roseovarius sp. Pro17 TaxID=3108175 RepID=UPI002D7861DD|nr:O-antigen ligase family protein [Roseovarius sp. Pro17]